MAVGVDKQLKRLLDGADLSGLFRSMGWDNPPPYYQSREVQVPDTSMTARAVADKRGVTAWEVRCPTGLPDRPEQHRVVRELRRRCRDQLTIFVDNEGAQRWLWPEQPLGAVRYRPVDHEHRRGEPGHALMQRLRKASFSVDEEEHLTASVVLERVRRSFNAAKVTKAFYTAFNRHRKVFVNHIEGTLDDEKRSWYASVLLNRLMFIYFIQQKGFLDGDGHYLSNRLNMVREHFGHDQFYAFFREFLLPLFHQGLGQPPPVAYGDPDIGRIIGTVPYVNGGIFLPHQLETNHLINIKDEAFEDIFVFFDKWRWHLDERPDLDDDDGKDINPDILGFIFEQYVNQKQQGAYYTKPDVTGYMAATAIIPAVVDRLVAAGLDDPCILLSNSDDEYIHDSQTYGTDKDLPPPEERPSSETPDPTLDVGLAGERWCDITHRRERVAALRKKLADPTRVWSIDDAVTENLDMETLIHDYLTQLVSLQECETAFGVLRSLTVCDPTVGSGAFLFAAIDVLEPMYTTLVYRATEIEARGGGTASFLSEARQHRGERYWLLKTICLHNLFGVDLMPEAVEIAKLRLFLKLVAQISDISEVEPLPDLDFNIKAGNLLVGLANTADADRITGGGLPFPAIAKATEAAKRAGEAYREFTSAQATAGRAWQDEDARQLLVARFEEARRVVDPALHELHSTSLSFEDWKETHSPFHWFAEFPEVWQDGTGGFDVIIGNPPYISKRQWKKLGYQWRGYKTQNCPDLYAACVERASRLLNDQGRMAMIVMHNLCFSRDFQPLRRHLSSRFPTLWISSYASRPSSLFAADVRNSILVSGGQQHRGLHTTLCHRWRTEKRPTLFSEIRYIHLETEIADRFHQWPFLKSRKLSNAFVDMLKRQQPITSLLDAKGCYKLGFKSVCSYSPSLFVEEPITIDSSTMEVVASRSKTHWFSFEDERHRDLAFLVLAGRWGSVWWLMLGDSFHVNRGTLASFPGDIERLAYTSLDNMGFQIRRRSLASLAIKLREELPNHPTETLYNKLIVGNYDLSKCRDITNEADLLLAELWGVEDAYEAAGNLRDRMVFGNEG